MTSTTNDGGSNGEKQLAAETLGHSRSNVTSAYYGGKPPVAVPKSK